MEITDKTRQRLIELIRGKLAEMYQYSVPKLKSDLKQEVELTLNSKISPKLIQNIVNASVEKHLEELKTYAENNDEIGGQYIERFTQETIKEDFLLLLSQTHSNVCSYPLIYRVKPSIEHFGLVV